MVTTVLLILALTASGTSEQLTPRMHRVRDNGDQIVAGLLDEAREHSATFRRLVETINETDGLVYVERGGCGQGPRACLLMTMMVSGPYRVLKIHIDVKREHADVIGSLGHELQHAIEVLHESGIRSAGEMFGFFARLAGGPTPQLDRLAFETEAATRTGDAVRSEFKASERAHR
jgi:hypothetical protein